MSFIDPDHDDYPYASGCCEADHNRDDGHTFVHFRRPTDDWNNRYLVHIAAFDKLNHNSQHLQRSLHDHDDRHHRHRKGSNQPIPGRQD